MIIEISSAMIRRRTVALTLTICKVMSSLNQLTSILEVLTIVERSLMVVITNNTSQVIEEVVEIAVVVVEGSFDGCVVVVDLTAAS